jgi:hypothetical protein
MLICSKKKNLLREKTLGGWFVLREIYCWLVDDKPVEHNEEQKKIHHDLF